MRLPTIATFYSPKQVCCQLDQSFSKSPGKPALVMKKLQESDAARFLESHSFSPFERDDFLTAHHKEYVDAFFAGREPDCISNGLPWSPELVDSVCYTNASLYNAQLHAYLNPSQVTFSPTSGFHHAQPEAGRGFCTFSGQVLAALRLYKEYGVSGAWIDLDAHFGNSIDDSRSFNPDLDLAIPRDCNINPIGRHSEYLANFQSHLRRLEQYILDGRIHWIGFAHGADSHEADDIPTGQLSTREWFIASSMFYRWIERLDRRLGKPIPLTIALFGGYRKDDYESVIDLHVGDIATCLKELVKAPLGFSWQSIAYDMLTEREVITKSDH